MSPVEALAERVSTMGALKGNDCCTETHVQRMTGPGCELRESLPVMITDDQLQRAAEQAEREGTERPLVMQQLKTKIQLARLRGGKGELTVTFEEPKTYELTEEEKKKQIKRKIRNREAAKKSRTKKKVQYSVLEENRKKLMKTNDQLRTEVNHLYDLICGFQEGIKRVRNCPHSHTAQSVQVHPDPSLSVPSSHRMGSGQFSRELSQRSCRGQQFIIKGNTKIPLTRTAKACFPSKVIFPRPKSTSEILSYRDLPLHTAARSASTSPRLEVMDVDEMPPRTFSSPRTSQENPRSSTRPLPAFTMEGTSEVMPTAGHYSGPPILPVPQRVETPMLQGISFLQLLRDAENPEQLRQSSNGVFIIPGHEVQGQDTFLGMDSQSPSSAKVLTSPVTSLNPIFGAVHHLERGS